jgi:hypothetical protein
MKGATWSRTRTNHFAGGGTNRYTIAPLSHGESNPDLPADNRKFYPLNYERYSSTWNRTKIYRLTARCSNR